MKDKHMRINQVIHPLAERAEKTYYQEASSKI